MERMSVMDYLKLQYHRLEMAKYGGRGLLAGAVVKESLWSVGPMEMMPVVGGALLIWGAIEILARRKQGSLYEDMEKAARISYAVNQKTIPVR